MKLVNEFKDFLKDTIDLNQSRIDMLVSLVATIKDFIVASD
jgi:hypothetical protein